MSSVISLSQIVFQSNATITLCGIVDNAFAITQSLPEDAQTRPLCLDACSLNTAGLVPVAAVSNFNLTTNTVVLTPAGGSAITENLALTSQLDGQPAPVFIDAKAELDVKSGLLKSYVTNKLFGHLDYEWADVCYSPKGFIGAEVEFAGKKHCQTMNAWGFYVGGSLTY